VPAVALLASGLGVLHFGRLTEQRVPAAEQDYFPLASARHWHLLGVSWRCLLCNSSGPWARFRGMGSKNAVEGLDLLARNYYGLKTLVPGQLLGVLDLVTLPEKADNSFSSWVANIRTVCTTSVGVNFQNPSTRNRALLSSFSRVSEVDSTSNPEYLLLKTQCICI
jgi:hypothetical protein